MCLVALAIAPDTDRPLVLAANRDEYHARPAAAAHWWPDRPGLVGGRDRRAGGTWLAASRAGRFAVLLNDPRRPVPPSAPTRGELAPGFLEAGDPGTWLSALAAARDRYAGFHLIAGDRAGVHYVGSTTSAPAPLDPGLHVIDNDGRDGATPRSRRALDCLGGALVAGEPEAMLRALGDRADPGPGDGDARPVFLAGEPFGTRCSTALILGAGAEPRARLIEQCFDAGAAPAGRSGFTWPLPRPGRHG